MSEWIDIEHELAIWVDADSFDFRRAEKRAPINSIVIVKTDVSSKGRTSHVITSYGIVGREGFVRISRRNASEVLSNRAVDYVKKTGRWPPCMNIKRVLESGDVELSFTITDLDSFTLKLTSEMVDGDPFEFLMSLDQCEKPHAPWRFKYQPSYDWNPEREP